jgi:hypothetical protein
MATKMQLGVLADLVEGRARRMWPGRWPERVAVEAEAASTAVEDEAERAGLVAELAELEAADWAPLLAAVACRRAGRQRKRTAGPPA